MSLTEFLLTRIAEDGEAASSMLRRAQEHELDCGEPQLLGKRIPGWYDWPVVQSMASRMLAECEAKRRIVEEAQDPGDDLFVRILATVHADHPDYRDEWRP